MDKLSKVMTKSALWLALYAMLGTALVSFTYSQTKEAIAKNEENVLLKQINELIPGEKYDNVVYSDKIEITNPALGIPTAVTFYRARMKEQPVAVAVTTEAPDGYSGTIKLLIGINYDGTIAGVRVLSHAETPGLGDKIETAKSDWVYSFDGKSIGNPTVEQWKVKKDGGIFDQFSGATITPRAVVGATRRTLEYFNAHRDEIFK